MVSKRNYSKVADVIMLLKLRLSTSVVVSAVAGYLLATNAFSWSVCVALIIGGFLIVGASNAYNQIWERDRDALMDRTKNRPVAAGRMSPLEAFIVASIALLLGLGLLIQINPLTAGFGALSVALYVLVYTPMKAKSPWAVFVGAFPGAIPFMLGWVASTNDFGIEPGTLFALQFIWQFPHFWAIAWVAYDDYAKAGYYLLPTRKKEPSSTRMAVIYSIWMVFLSILPVFGITELLTLSIPAAFLVAVLGVWIIVKAVQFHRGQNNQVARRLMLATIAYLPLVQIIYVIDRYI